MSLLIPLWFKLQNGYFDNKYFWNWSDECCWRYIHNWININGSKFLGFFVRYFGKIFRLDIGQISFNLVKKASATWQLAFLPLASRFTTFWLRHAKKSKFWDKKIKWPTSFQVKLLFFLIFFRFFPLFFSFCCSDWPSKMGLLAVKKLHKGDRDEEILPWSSHV